MTDVQPDLAGTPRRRFAAPAPEHRVARTAAALEANGMTVLRAASSAEARRIVVDLIPTGSQVHQGASQSLQDSGITEELVTETGSLVTASVSGSQLDPYASGAGKVILVVESQKVVPAPADALARIDDYVLPSKTHALRPPTAYGAP